MIVAILDDGICKEEISTPLEIYRVGNKVKKDAVIEKRRSHGTICAKIIESYSSPDKIIDIAFLSSDDTADIDDMCAALELCISLKPDVINMSCGIEVFDRHSVSYKKLYDLCHKLHEKGIVIFAAQSNDGVITIPAMFSSVISVEQRETIGNVMRFPFRRSDIYTNGRQKIEISGKKYITQKCCSYSCAYATAQFINGRNMSNTLFSSDVSTMYRKSLMANDKLIGYKLYDKNSKRCKGNIYFNDFPFYKRFFSLHKPKKYFVLEYGLITRLIITLVSLFQKKTDVPVIYIKNEKNSGEAAVELASAFSYDNYTTAILSAEKKHFVLGAYYVPENIIKNYINYFTMVSDVDILFVVSDIQEEEDINIYSNKNGYSVKTISGIRNYSNIPSLKQAVMEYYM